MMVWIPVGILALIIIVGAAAWILRSRRRTGALQDRFGPEYDRVVDRRDSRRAAEAELQRRERRRDELDLRPLPTASRRRYLAAWRSAQVMFVDDPKTAVAEADRLVTSVMTDRGYPMDHFEQRAEDISVDHPRLVRDYRSAHHIANLAAKGKARTEDLREAMLHFRALFEELLQEPRDTRAQAG
jgi:hypothetical protein